MEIDDTYRLEWLVLSHAMIAHTRDGEKCFLVWPYGLDPHDGDRNVSQKHMYDSPLDAIDAAILGKDDGTF